MELPVRKSNRLKGYDYSQNGAYFITICTKNRQEILGKIINERSILNEYGLVVKREIEKISVIRKECDIKQFVIMPNHIHLIVQIISDTVGDDGNRPAGNNAHPNNGTNMQQRADCHVKRGKIVYKSNGNMVYTF